jgi:VanZ family protein
VKIKIIFWTIFGVSGVAFFSPISVQEPIGLGLDKIVHVILFAALMISGAVAFPKKIVFVSAMLLVYTFSTEIIQGNFIPHRSFDVFDIMADCIGIMMGAILIEMRVLRTRNKLK